jgi:hypothetical protein
LAIIETEFPVQLYDPDAPAPPAGVHSALVMVTPKLANIWLKHNTANRNQRNRHVARLARDMIRDAWMFTGEPIIFDREGVLRNGQHRLTALTLAKTTIPMCVVWGVEPTVQDVLDSGAARSLVDTLRARDEKNVAALAAAIRLCWHLESGLLPFSTIQASRAELLQWLEVNPGITASVTLMAPMAHLPLGFVLSAAAAWHYSASRELPEEADRFQFLLRTGENLAKGHPVYAFDRWLGHRESLPGRRRAEEYLATVIKAFNAFVEGRPMRLVSWRPGVEGFPKLVRRAPA